MKLIVLASFVVLAISAYAEEEEWAEIDWNQVVPAAEIPGFWDAREMKEPLLPTRAGRIVGGTVVSPNSIPWQAGLIITLPSGTILCGGSLVSTTRVVTAAHCVVGSSSTQVVLGAHSIITMEPSQQRRTVSPGNYRNHPQYNPNNWNNDVSVLIMPSAVTITTQVRTIPIAPASAPTFAGVTATMSGWGATTTGGPSTNLLRSTTNTVVTNDQCRQFHANQFVIDSTICSSTAGGRGICQGQIILKHSIKFNYVS
jgi:secreted trypsin-like serine protease